MAKGGLRYRSTCSAPAQPVWVDRDMWEKIVLNLLSNAFKFTLARRRHRHPGAATKAWLRLSVRDTGSGIPASRTAARVRALPPHRRHARPHLRGHRHRPGADPGTGAPAWRQSSPCAASRAKARASTSTCPSAMRTCRQERIVDGERRPTRRRARMGAAFVEEAMRWLPDAQADGGAAAARAGQSPLQPAAPLPAHPDRRRQQRHARLPQGAARAACRGDGVRRRRSGLRAPAARTPRPAAERRDDAEARRLRPDRRASAPTRGAARPAGHAAVGARRRGSQGRRPAVRRRRLPGEAVLRRRAAGARPAPAAAGPRAPPATAGIRHARIVFPHAGRRRPGDALDHRRGQPVHLPEPPLVRIHRPQLGAGPGAGLARERPPGRPGAHPRRLPGRHRRRRSLPHRLPPAPPRRRVSLVHRRRHAALRRGWPAERLCRHRHRRPRAHRGRGRTAAHGAGAGREEPHAKRVPVHARARAAQPAGADPHRPRTDAAAIRPWRSPATCKA